VAGAYQLPGCEGIDPGERLGRITAVPCRTDAVFPGLSCSAGHFFAVF